MDATSLTTPNPEIPFLERCESVRFRLGPLACHAKAKVQHMEKSQQPAAEAPAADRT
jgi:hypothetical protein